MRRAAMAVLVLGGLAAPGEAPAAEPVFNASTSIATGLGFPDEVRAGDLDGDGDEDLVGAIFSDNDVIAYLNTNGDASAWSAITVDNNLVAAKDVALADIDGDGDLDVVAAALNGNEVAWYDNTAGTGLTWSKVSIAACTGGYAVAPGDFDGDGDIDVAGVCASTNDVVWWENDGGGGGWAATTVEASFAAGSALRAADVNGDGAVDLVGAAFTGDAISWFENDDGDGAAWTTHAIAASYSEPLGVDVGDMDGDGDIDVLGTSSDTGTVDFFENTNGQGTSWAASAVDASFPTAESVRPVDLDEDGDLDVLVAGATTFAWYENDGTATAWTAATLATLTTAESAHAADLNGDGDLDPVIVDSVSGGTVQWLPNDTIHHGSEIDAETLVSTLAQAKGVAAGDVDGDGDVDMALSTSSGVLQWADNGGGGATFTLQAVDTGVGNAVELALLDVDGDGDLDIAGASLDLGDVTWWENTAGDGSAWTEVTVDAAFAGANSIAGADMDDDGDLDLVAAASSADDVSWFENTLGDGTAWTEHRFENNVDGAADAAVGDLDGDGDLDIAAAALVADDIAVYLFSSAGTANTETTIAAAADGANSVALGDLDADGDLDIVAGLGVADQVLWFANDGAGGGWTQRTVDASFDGARAVDAFDFDGDGDVDVVAAAADGDEVAWWENSGAAVPLWTKRSIDGALDGPHGLALADVDADGATDVVAAGTVSGLVSWWGNERAQVTSSTADIATATPVPPLTSTGALAIDPEHLGRFGDNAAEVATIGVRLENGAGVALTTAQASAVFSDVHVYVDANGNDTFESASDTFIASSGPPTLTAGAMTITLPDGHLDLDFGLVSPPTLLVVPETASASGSALIPNVRVVHDVAATTMEDDDFDTLLTDRVPAEVFATVPIDQPPTAHAGPAAGAYTVAEGTPLTMDGSLSTDAETSVTQWAWDCDNDGSYETVAATAGGASCTFVDDGVATVGLQVTDATGQMDTATGSVTVTNALPTISSVAPTTATEGVLYSYSATATDPGTADTFTWALTASPAGMGVVAGTGVVSWTPTFADEGANAVTLEVTDDDGGSATQSWTITVVAADVDSDGMADGWELLNGLDPTVDDSALDPDGDGLSNLDEYLGGTDPNAFDGPDAPTPVAPIGGAEVVTAVPTLSWTNATDPQNDALTYDVEVYSDAGMATLLDSATGVAETATTSSNQVVTALAENSDPYWRVRAADPYVAGPWSNLETFFVNTFNEAPAAPSPTAPIGGQSVGDLRPTLVWAEAVDPDRDAMTYDVRLWDEALTAVLAEASGIAPAGGSAEWVVTIDLTEDERYAWEARAVDDGGLHGPWSAAETFFVNTVNQAPGDVTFTAPDDGAVLEPVDPTLACTETTDPENETISYVFELSLTAGFEAVEETADVPHTGTGEAAWVLADEGIELEDNVTWHARVRAEDELGAASDWDTISFFVRGPNDPPEVPTLIGPEDGADAAGAVFTAAHAVDPEGDDVTYGFVIARDEALTDVVEQADDVAPSAGPAGTADQTSWQATAALSGALFWSARSVDEGGAASDWAAARSLSAGRDVVLEEPGPDETGCRLSIGAASAGGLWLLPLLVAVRRRRGRAGSGL